MDKLITDPKFKEVCENASRCGITTEEIGAALKILAGYNDKVAKLNLEFVRATTAGKALGQVINKVLKEIE